MKKYISLLGLLFSASTYAHGFYDGQVRYIDSHEYYEHPHHHYHLRDYSEYQRIREYRENMKHEIMCNRYLKYDDYESYDYYCR
jgi:hypothetical protein